jgi:hypothetical protein
MRAHCEANSEQCQARREEMRAKRGPAGKTPPHAPNGSASRRATDTVLH